VRTSLCEVLGMMCHGTHGKGFGVCLRCDKGMMCQCVMAPMERD